MVEPRPCGQLIRPLISGPGLRVHSLDNKTWGGEVSVLTWALGLRHAQRDDLTPNVSGGAEASSIRRLRARGTGRSGRNIELMFEYAGRGEPVPDRAHVATAAHDPACVGPFTGPASAPASGSGVGRGLEAPVVGVGSAGGGCAVAARRGAGCGAALDSRGGTAARSSGPKQGVGPALTDVSRERGSWAERLTQVRRFELVDGATSR